MKLLENKILKYALMIFGALILYFHLMQILGLAHVIELRSINGLFLASGIFLFLKDRKKQSANNFNYLSSFFSALGVGVLTSLFFTSYISTYVFIINPEFYSEIMSVEALGSHITKLSVPIVIFMESAASAYLFTYISMQYLKKEKSFENGLDIIKMQNNAI